MTFAAMGSAALGVALAALGLLAVSRSYWARTDLPA
jgi:hypothetical protein